MKVLFIGYKNPSFLAVTDYIEIALKAMGHDVLFFDHRGYIVPGRFRDRVSMLENWDRARINRNLRNLVSDFRPDLLLVCGGYNLEPETIMYARKSGVMTAAWFADYPYLFDRYLLLAPHYDHFFTSGTDALERQAAAGHLRGHWLPFACLPDMHRPVALTESEKAAYESEVAFVGTAYRERIDLLSQLTRFKLAVWGPGWTLRLPDGHPLRAFVRGGSIPTESWIRAASGTKISINYMGSSGSDIDPKEEKMANSRVFELLGCATFQVVDAKEDVVALFKSGEELVCFDKSEEIPGIVQYYLEHDSERLAIAHRARESALKYHTYEHRLTDLIRICGKGT